MSNFARCGSGPDPCQPPLSGQTKYSSVKFAITCGPSSNFWIDVAMSFSVLAGLAGPGLAGQVLPARLAALPVGVRRLR